MKIIKKLIGISVFSINCILFITLNSCNENNIEKKEFIANRGPIKIERSKVIKSHKWKLQRIYLYNSTNFVVTPADRIRFEKIDNKIFEFKEDGIYINNEFKGNASYKGEIFTINDIDTLTNNYYLYRLKNDVLTLKNDVGYYKNNKLLKSLSIELLLTPL
ncbi:hypothetical protein [Chryseobacterium nepalense]|uniref:hypothetical protein n=1 Tax=Chryseobacterium nepalense TaxID=1854498 RepID=UPI002DF90389|nr:hypothetical protein [Chryseobacterium nepalense]